MIRTAMQRVSCWKRKLLTSQFICIFQQEAKEQMKREQKEKQEEERLEKEKAKEEERIKKEEERNKRDEEKRKKQAIFEYDTSVLSNVRGCFVFSFFFWSFFFIAIVSTS